MKTFFDLHQNTIKLPPNEKVHWRISAYAIVRGEGDKILMITPGFDNSKQVLPGGRIESNESIAAGVARECYEETGYRVKLDATHPFYTNELGFHFDKKFYHSLMMFYEASLISKNQDEHMINSAEEGEVEKVEWLSLSEVNEKNCHYSIYPVIKSLK